MKTEQQKQHWLENRKLETAEVLNRLPIDVKPYAYIVGVWVWIEFEQKPDRLTLDSIKEIGFSWNNRRKVWQHPCGCFRPSSTDDPRFRFGAVPVQSSINDDLKQNTVSANL
ncbi:MAG: hypothetical protein GY839_03050 [candidate division Zixibacteria bacterium]|nr:hypothetical protein [candidate division Zixibacteria bacterium]